MMFSFLEYFSFIWHNKHFIQPSIVKHIFKQTIRIGLEEIRFNDIRDMLFFGVLSELLI